MTASDFTPDQKRYLEGFVSGIQASRVARGTAPIGGGAAPANGEGAPLPPAGQPEAPSGPDAAHLIAQNQVFTAGKKLSNEEKVKRDEHPFDIYARMKQAARDGVFPKAGDVFRWKFHGLFYVAPAQDSFMCRLRLPNGILTHWQFRGVADIARRLCGNYAHVTTRANLQIREIGAHDAIAVLEELQALGIVTRGSGADNIRNVTGGATAGIDPDELIDTRPYAREWHYHILNNRSLYGLPRKFNVAFDGGGRIPTLEETNDIAFRAVRVRDGAAVAPGVYFRLGLGGITGHQDLASDTGVVVAPEDCSAVADAIVRVFIDHGDRTSRQKARLKYVLDAWGAEKFLAAVEERLGRPLARVDAGHCTWTKATERMAHIGVHPQRQQGLNYLGVVLPVGRLSPEQMEGLADIAATLGDGDIRLTVWQNLIISGVPDAAVDDAKARVEALGLDWRATAVRAGLVACTGKFGCRLANSETKNHAMAIAEHLESRVTLDQPLNIHLTGCPNSCAQHYIGDIGLVGTPVSLGEDSDETVDGFHIVVGGGYGDHAGIGRELYRDIPATDAPAVIERLVRTYLARRAGPNETFLEFTRRHEIEALVALFNEGVSS